MKSNGMRLAAMLIMFAALGCSKAEKEATAKTLEPVKAAVGPCAAKFADIAGQVGGDDHTCRCSADQVKGSVWGSEIYTADSSICKAAVHAGAIPASGGVVTLKSAPGCEAYAGSSTQGIKTSSWGRFKQSFVFPGHGAGKCAPPPPKGTCPDKFTALVSTIGDKEHKCTCTSSQVSGSVWGSGIYTADSSVCKAAVHAGAIPNTGGEVKLKAANGCNAYAGSTQNGISTGKWGAYKQSFVFPGHGDGACAKK